MKALLRIALFALSTAAALPQAQQPLTNEDIVKFTKAGLTEDFILNQIQQQPSNLSSDVARLIELKNNGVTEAVVLAVAKKAPPQEPLTSGGLIRLVKAEFSEGFLLDLMDHYPAQIATDPARLVELKQAGVPESVLSAAVRRSPPPGQVTPSAISALAKAGFSDDFLLEILNRQPVKPAPGAATIVELKQAGVSERVLNAMLKSARSFEIPANTQITIRLIDEIDSEKAKPGDQFQASVDEQVAAGGETLIPKGADAVVKLVSETESGRLTGRTELTVQLASVTVDGRPVPLNTSTVAQASGSRGSRTAKTAAVTGAVGAIIGAIAGGGRGAAIGAGAGAAAGAGSQVFMKGQRVRIPSETLLTFTVQNPIRVDGR